MDSHNYTNQGSQSHTRWPIRQSSFLAKIVARCAFPPALGSWLLTRTRTDSIIDGCDSESEMPLMGEDCIYNWESGQDMVTIDILPDNALLRIFSFYLAEELEPGIEKWHTLIHVCIRWRCIVFASQRRLNLRLRCTAGTQAREILDFWPTLPVAIRGLGHAALQTQGICNILAALKHNDRIYRIELDGFSSWQLKSVATVMRKLYPHLTHLRLSSFDETAPILTGDFLGESAPRLRSLTLRGIAFPGIRKLLSSSADHLVHLHLGRIPHSGYISPEAIVTCLSALPNLERLYIGFRSPRSRPDRPIRHPPQFPRVILFALTHFWFDGVSEYIEDLVSRIDVPQLDHIEATFFNEFIFNSPRLREFLARTETFKAGRRPTVIFSKAPFT